MCKYFIYDKIIVYNARGVSRRQMFFEETRGYKILRKGGLMRMRDIVISIRNDFIAQAVIGSLEKSGEFQPFKLLFSRDDEVVHECARIKPELLLCEVAFGMHTDFETRMKEANEVRKVHKNCKVVFLCDENSSPVLAKRVMQAKRDGLIDAFFYSSVGTRYLIAALTAL